MINEEQRKFIKIALINKGMKQQELADKLHRKRQQVNNVINGIVENLRLEEDILDYVGWYKYEKNRIKNKG